MEQVRRERGGESPAHTHGPAVDPQPGAVQGLSGNHPAAAAVKVIPCQRVADMRHMGPYLVGAPGQQPEGQQVAACCAPSTAPQTRRILLPLASPMGTSTTPLPVRAPSHTAR